ncbi:MAG: hypothetical protein ACREBA_00820 [Nitrosotalea sp.]
MRKSRILITNGQQSRVVQKSKTSSKPSPDLTPEELEVIERFESGKGKYRHFENARDEIKWLHGKDRKARK